MAPSGNDSADYHLAPLDENVCHYGSLCSASKTKICEVCQKKANIICAACSTSYCSVKHEADDWKMHHNSCPSYKLVQKPSKPSYLVATRKIPKGAVVFESKPLVVGPNGSEPVCLGCLCPIIYDVMSDTCSVCKWPMCFGCLQSKAHQLECQAMQRAGFCFDESALRGWWHDNCVFGIFPGIWLLVVRVLLSGLAPVLLKVYRKEDHDISEILMSSFPGGVSFIRDTLKLTQFETNDIYCVTKVLIKSSYALRSTRDSYGQYRARSGSGVHVSDIVHLQHSCLPNMRLIETCEEPEVQKAISVTDIAAGEVLCNDKTNLGLLCTRDRLFRLRCTCLRCTDPRESGLYLGSFPCKKCSGMLVPERPLQLSPNVKCEKCHFSVSYFPHFFTLENKIYQEIGMPMDGKDLGALAKLIDDHSGPKGYLHYNHHLILRAKEIYCASIFAGTTAKGAAYQFSTPVLRRFYQYTKDLMTVLSELRMDSYTVDCRSKLVNCQYIVHQWVRGELSTKKAEQQLVLILNEAQARLNSSCVMDKDVNLTYTFIVQDISLHWSRIHSPK